VILVASVPHSGSRFVLKLLGKPAFFWHVYQGESLEYITELGKFCPVVVPLRHPRAVAQSWVNRGKPIRTHAKHEAMCVMFRTLIDVVDKLKPLYLPVDVPNRDEYLSALKGVAGELHTNWEPVTDGLPQKALSEDDELAVSELLADPFFARFGYT
jgi:hypothetical protein